MWFEWVRREKSTDRIPFITDYHLNITRTCAGFYRTVNNICPFVLYTEIKIYNQCLSASCKRCRHGFRRYLKIRLLSHYVMSRRVVNTEPECQTLVLTTRLFLRPMVMYNAISDSHGFIVLSGLIVWFLVVNLSDWTEKRKKSSCAF